MSEQDEAIGAVARRRKPPPEATAPCFGTSRLPGTRHSGSPRRLPWPLRQKPIENDQSAPADLHNPRYADHFQAKERAPTLVSGTVKMNVAP